jgi:hypothetical protein
MAYTYTRIDGQRVEAAVSRAYVRLEQAFRQRFGLDLKISSGTRTRQEQINIFTDRYRVQASGNGPFGDVRWWNGQRWVRHSGIGTVAQPGTSNHEEYGPRGPRALDIYDSGRDAGVTRYNNERSRWIKDNAHRFGFDPAGYDHFNEPWHIEYTGGLGGSPASTGTPTEVDVVTSSEMDQIADRTAKRILTYKMDGGAGLSTGGSVGTQTTAERLRQIMRRTQVTNIIVKQIAEKQGIIAEGLDDIRDALGDGLTEQDVADIVQDIILQGGTSGLTQDQITSAVDEGFKRGMDGLSFTSNAD